MTTTTTQREAPVLAMRSLPAGTDGYRVPLTFKVEGGLHFIRGNSAPYFSLTYWSHRKGFPNQCESGGAGHERILKYYPRFADLAALHLSDIDGEPMYAEKNGWYWLAGALGGAGERYHGGSGDYGKTIEECLEIFARHCRIDLEEAHRIRADVARIGRDAWSRYCEGMRPRWKQEADACIAAHDLRVFGDPWEGVTPKA